MSNADDNGAPQGAVTLDATRFQRVLDVYGADPRRWPHAERAAAQAYRAVRPHEAEPLIADAAALDALLAAAPSQQPSAALMGAILAAAPQGARPENWAQRLRRAGVGGALQWGAWLQAGFGRPARWGGVFAAALMFGIALGYWVGDRRADQERGEALMWVASDPVQAGFSVVG